MKKGIVDPLALLREYVSGNKPIKLSSESLYFGSVKLPLNTPTAWKPKTTKIQYNLGDLWLFLDSYLNPSNYTNNKYYDDMKKYELQKIAQLDQEEVVKYFTGKAEDSEAIDQELKATLKTGINDKKKTATQKSTEQDPLLKKKSKTDEEIKDGDHEGAPVMDSVAIEKENVKIMEILSRVEKVIDSKNRMLRKASKVFQSFKNKSKSFKSILNYLVAPETKEPERPLLNNLQSQSSNTSSKEVAPKKIQAATKLEEVLNIGGSLNAANPIILVFPQPTPGSLSLDNAKDFLMYSKYVDLTNQKASQLDKNKVTIQREINDKKYLFDVMADTNVIKKENLWPRVVAIFLNGHNYQFQGWPDGDKIAVFLSKSKMNENYKLLERGYFMKYHDMATPENIKNWNVLTLEVHRTKRYMDATIKNKFWEDLETFLLQPPK